MLIIGPSQSLAGSQVKVVIVGAGVAGCYCAYRLAHAGHSLELYEASDRIGGRLWSVPLQGIAGSPAEIGGMFYSDMHRNTFGLIQSELGLASQKVNWTRRHQYLRGKYLDDDSYEDAAIAIPFNLHEREAGKQPAMLLVHALKAIVPRFLEVWPLDITTPGNTPQASVAYLRQLKFDGRELVEWGFWNLLAEVVSNEAYNLLTATIGSAAIFRNVNAYDAIWTLMLEMAEQTYYSITDGYQSLPETLLRKAGAACGVHRNMRLDRLDRRGTGFTLHFENGETRSQVEADKVILALPQRALELVEIDEAIVAEDAWRDLLASVVPVPASKLFLTFERSWWNDSDAGPTTRDALDVSVAYTDLPMRQCYYYGAPGPDDPVLLMATYADDVASSYWSGLRHPDYCEQRPSRDLRDGFLCSSLAMEKRAIRQLAEMHQDYVVPEPIDGLFFDWSADPYGAAWHAWSPYCKSWEVIPLVRQPNPALGLFVCGEAYSQHQGWVEGALNSAEMVLQKLGLEPPGWVDRGYHFEFAKEISMSNGLLDLLVDLSGDLAVQKEYAADPEAVMARYKLSEDEKAALRSGDEAKILAASGGQSQGKQVFKIIIATRPPGTK